MPRHPGANIPLRAMWSSADAPPRRPNERGIDPLFESSNSATLSERDEYTAARMAINVGRLRRIPTRGDGAQIWNAWTRRFPSDSTPGTLAERRRTLALFMDDIGQPVPPFVPVIYGYADCNNGLLNNPSHEPGANGRTYDTDDPAERELVVL